MHLRGLVTLVALCGACGPHANSTTVKEDPQPEDVVGEPYRAIVGTSGGELATPSGAFSLQVPAGAVAAPTEVVVTPLDAASVPDASTLCTGVYDLDPDSVELAGSVIVSFACAPGAQSGQRATVSWLSGGVWRDARAVVTGGGRVMALIDEAVFVTGAQLAARLVPAVLLAPDENTCDSYTPCGGGVVGTWTFERVCGTGSVDPAPYPGEPACSATTVQRTVKYLGGIEFRGDGTYTQELRQALGGYRELEPTCLAALWPAGEANEVRCLREATRLGLTSAAADAYVACEGSPSSCACRQVAMGGESTVNDSYEDLGVQLRLGASSYVSYCVDAAGLKLGSSQSYYSLVR